MLSAVVQRPSYRYYGVSASDINFLSTIFMILYGATWCVSYGLTSCLGRFLPGLVGSSLLTHRYGSRTMVTTPFVLWVVPGPHV